MEASVGQCVKIKKDAPVCKDACELSGRQGRIIEILSNGIITLSWDSITLNSLPASEIKACERQGEDWQSYCVYAEDIEIAQERDTAADVNKISESLSEKYFWSHLGNQGDRIQQILGGSDTENKLLCWFDYLKKHLKFPIQAEVAEHQMAGPLECDDKVLIAALAIPEYQEGLLAEIEWKGSRYLFPLSDLAVCNTSSLDYEPIDDYRVWHANR